MNNGYYNGVAGMVAASRAQEIVANNLANAQTSGFKAQIPFVEALEHALASSKSVQPLAAGRGLDLAPGPLRSTGRPLDFAIEGPYLLAVETPRGERYTRDGRLTVDSSGNLVTLTGHPVLGESGPLAVTDGGAAEVAPNGAIMVAGKEVGRLRLVSAPEPRDLESEGIGLYAAPAPLDSAPEATVLPAHTEASNVDPIAATVTLIETMRRFEALSKSSEILMGQINKSLFEEMGRSVGR